MQAFVECPHCGGGVVIAAVNCGVFRHAAVLGGPQCPPHASRAECEAFLQQAGAVGCGKPFRVTGPPWAAAPCDYI